MNKPAPISTTEATPVPDYAAIKTKQNAAWGSGNYAKIGTTLQIVGENLAEAMDLRPYARVLDVAAGNGNATLAFARRWADVTSTDYVESLLEKSKCRAEAEDLDITFKVADAEALPFADNSFHGVVSTFGVMFTPNQMQSASELVRVCAPGGKIGLANWTPQSFIGHLFKAIGKNVAPPAGVQSPAQWGDRDWNESTFCAQMSDVDFKLKNFVFRYPSTDHFISFFRTYYGPVHKAFLALDLDGQAQLEEDLRSTVERFNVATDGTMKLHSEYAEIVLTKK